MDDAMYQEAYLRVLYLTQQKKRFGLLLGPPDSGKSELLQRLQQEFRTKNHRVKCFDFSQSETIINALLEHFVGPEAVDFQSDPPGILWSRLNQTLLEEFSEPKLLGEPVPMIFLDHVDLYDQNVVQEIVRLIRFHDVNHIPRVFLAAANSEFAFSLDSHLLNRIDLKIEINET